LNWKHKSAAARAMGLATNPANLLPADVSFCPGRTSCPKRGDKETCDYHPLAFKQERNRQVFSRTCIAVLGRITRLEICLEP
jgi:hypothetical protein